MDMVEKKDSQNNNNNQGASDTSLIDREAEDRERQARDLKAGLHPLKVYLFLFLFFIVSISFIKTDNSSLVYDLGNYLCCFTINFLFQFCGNLVQCFTTYRF